MLGPIMMDLQALELSAEEAELIQHPLIAGIILFQRNYHSRQQLTELITNIRKRRPELLIAVDQEGGRVQRFSSEFTTLPSLASLGELYEKDQQQALAQTAQHAKTMASELLSVGIDFSFAPVLDLNKSLNQVIGDRSFHHNFRIVMTLASVYIKAMRQLGMACVGKHFPGHGSVTVDTHHSLAIDERSLAEIINDDMQVFIKLISDDLTAIMPAHIIFPAVDDKPVGFSAKWLQTILRQQFNFSGVIISDDLSMHGASSVGNSVTRVEQALQAGCDMVLFCNERPGLIEVLDQLSYQQDRLVQQRLISMRSTARIENKIEV